MASAAEPVWRTGAVGHERPRLAGGPRGRDLADQHDRRCDQPMVCAICGQRLDRGEHEPAGALRTETRAAVGVLHRQSVDLSNRGENQTGRQSIGEEPRRTATDADRPGIAGVGNPLDSGAQPAGERESGARIFDGPGPAGEGHACGAGDHLGASQPLRGDRVSTGGQRDACGGACQSRRCSPATGEASRFGRDSQPRGEAAGERRLHLPVGRQNLPDRAPGHQRWAPRSLHTGGATAGWFGGRLLWRTVSQGGEMRAEAQGNTSQAGPDNRTAQAGREERMEPELRSEEGAEGLAGSARLRSPTRGAVMTVSTGLRRKWREGKSSPYTGKLSARPAGKPGDFLIAKEGLRRSLPRHCFPQLQRTILGAQYAFWKAWRNLSVRCGQTTTKPWDGTVPPPAGRPRAQVEERVGRTTLCSSSAMSSDRLFLDRGARQHCPSPLHRHGQTTTPPRPARLKPDISTLQRIGHFYFALTRFLNGSAYPVQLVHNSLPDRIAQCRNLFYVPAVHGNGIQYPKMDIVWPSKNPRVARQSGSGAFHHQRQYRDVLTNRQLKRTLVEGQDPPVRRPGSFGEQNHRTSLAQVTRTLQQGGRGLAPVGSFDRHVPCHAEHPAQERQAEQLRLGEPFGIQLEMGNHRDIGQVLMIANDDVRLVPVEVFTAGNVDSPGVDSGNDAPQPAEPASGSQAARLNVKQPDGAQQRDPKENEGCGRSPNPRGS